MHVRYYCKLLFDELTHPDGVLISGTDSALIAQRVKAILSKCDAETSRAFTSWVLDWMLTQDVVRSERAIKFLDIVVQDRMWSYSSDDSSDELDLW